MKEAKYAHAVLVEWIEMQIYKSISIFLTVAGNFI